MSDVASLFREYAHLDLKRMDGGLSIPELERWSTLKQRLDRVFKGMNRSGPDPRRSSRRVTTHLNCSFASTHEFDEAVITDLATGGVFVRTTSPLPVGAKLQLRIRLEDTGAEIEVEGVVVSNNIGPHFETHALGMGVRFAHVSVDVLEQISALYAGELQREVSGTAGDPGFKSTTLRRSA